MRPVVRYGIVAALVLLSTIVILDASPALRPIPLTDSAVFLYIGEQVLDGAIPYRDLWDHKGPLIYYINALGQVLTPESRWGVWWLEVVAVGAAAWLGFALMRRAFGLQAALFGSVAWILGLRAVLDGGNLVEEYALPLQFAALYFFWRSRNSANPWNEVGIGIMSALAFLLRPNIIGIPTAIMLVLIWQFVRGRDRRILYQIAVILGSILSILLIVSAYFAAQGALPQLWDNVFTYNFVYSASNWGARLISLEGAFELLTALSVFSVGGWVLLFGCLRNYKEDGGQRQFLAVLLLAFPLELALVSFAGRSFPHYYMSLLPVSALLNAFLIFHINENLKESSPLHLKKGLAVALLLGVVVGAFQNVRLPAQQLASQLSSGRPLVDLPNSYMGPFLAYTEENLTEEDTLVVWGSELAANWLSGYENPTRSIYQIQFFSTPGYPTKALGEELYNDILENKPVIIDASVSIQGFRSFGVRLGNVPGEIRPVYDYVKRFYERVDVIDPYGWPVYRYVGPSDN